MLLRSHRSDVNSSSTNASSSNARPSGSCSPVSLVVISISIIYTQTDRQTDAVVVYTVLNKNVTLFIFVIYLLDVIRFC